MKKSVCVIGYGAMGKCHVDRILKSDVVSLAGIYDLQPEKLDEARKAGVFAYDSYEAVLMDDTVDIITVVTRNETHKDYVIRALEAGKHVICEKPAALNSAELQEMIDASERSGKRFTVHQNRRFNVDYLALKQLIDSGELGKIYNVESRIHGSRGIPSGWRAKKEYGGGMLYDWGIHLIDQMVKLIPEKIVRISCRLDHITVSEVDDGFRLTLDFESGTSAYIEVGTYNMISMPRFYLRAQRATALVEHWQEPCRVTRLKAWTEAEALGQPASKEPVLTMTPRDELTTDTYTIAIPAVDVHDFYRNFCAAIDGKEEQLVTHTDMLRVLRVIELAFASAEQGRPVFCTL